MANEGTYYGPRVVTDSLVFCFDAGNLRCTHTDRFGQYQGSVDVTSMFNVAPVRHSSQTALGGQSNPEIKGVVGVGNTGNFSFPTDTGAATAIDLSISAKNSSGDSDDYANALTLYVDSDSNPSGKITFADQAAQSYEFWGKLNSGSQNTYQSLAGRNATSGPWIIQYRNNSTSWTIRYRDNDGQYRNSSTQTSSCTDQYHQMVFSIGTDRDIHFYVDGAFVNTVTSTDTAASINRIMAGYSSGTNKFGYQGTFLCCRIYSKELSADEVKQNFEATRWRVGI